MIVDLRSDTVTKPSRAMLEAMMSAKVGDDVFGDDPTVNELEAKVAALFGKESAIFCPSGTMTNQIAIKVHTQPGDDVICDQLSHIYNYEGGGIAFNSGCSVKLLQGDRGRFTAEMVESAINPDDVHAPVSRLVSIENTCNKGGGSIWDQAEIKRIAEVCSKNNLALHLDGARLFNALDVNGLSPIDAGAPFDSISICLSKGLGCPVGSLLIGSKGFIYQARRVRKVLGGGMRQVGIIAAAGIYALDHHISRISDDHRRAQALGDELEKYDWVKSVLPVDTNIVVAELNKKDNQMAIINQLSEAGILVVGFGAGKIRFVTHLDLDDNALNFVLEKLKTVK